MQRRLPTLKLFLEKMLVCDGIVFFQLSNEIRMVLTVKQHESVSLSIPRNETLKKVLYIEEELNKELMEIDKNYEYILKVRYIFRIIFEDCTMVELRFRESRRVRNFFIE